MGIAGRWNSSGKVTSRKTWHIGGRYCPGWLEHMHEERVLPNVTGNSQDAAHAGLIGHGKEWGFYSVCNGSSGKGFQQWQETIIFHIFERPLLLLCRVRHLNFIDHAHKPACSWKCSQIHDSLSVSLSLYTHTHTTYIC